MDHLFPYPKMGSSFLEILQDPLTRKLVGHEISLEEDALPFMLGVATRLEFLLRNPAAHLSFLKIGYSALEAFLQSNCTGPPLDFNSEEVIIPKLYRREDGSLAELKKQLLQSLAVDGTTVYALTPNVELFWLAKAIMSNSVLAEEGFNGRRARIRVNFIHQKLLLEKSNLLQAQIYTDAEILEQQLTSRLKFHAHAAEEHFVEFLLERAAICTYYGDEEMARLSLAQAAKTRDFQFTLTGALGKRTKFQDTDLSQLIVLAKSRDFEPEPYSSRKSSRGDGMDSRNSSSAANSRPTPTSLPAGPTNIPLNDDTLLEAISFKQISVDKSTTPTVSNASSLPPALASLDPANQPLLFPVDSILLLAIASSISNTSPADGLTREETLPYATRVLEGGSSNWQVYSQALLVRSRIEGYRSRTAERGLLQLQALVDQVIAETTSSSPPPVQESHENDSSTTTTTTNQSTNFLPRPKFAESATPADRLMYIYQLSPPLRWELESELAARWVSLGGLKTALEIYERLEMFAEVALCLAGTEREAEAIKVIRKLLFEPSEKRTNAKAEADGGGDVPYTGPERMVLPAEAPRLLCILGDLEDKPGHYERAWTVSKGRYARAQRSLGRYWVKRKQYTHAAEAYSKSLEVNKLNASTWFALGCVQLELQDWAGAVESFSRTVQLETEDAEALSNLAAALLRLPAEGDDEVVDVNGDEVAVEEPDDMVEEAKELSLTDAEADADKGDVDPQTTKPDPYKNTRDALSALRRAAQLKRDNARIWDNYLTVAASLPPPWTPWSEIILAQKRVIELRGKTKGESAVDEKIVEVLVAYVTSEYDYPKAADLEEEALEAQSYGRTTTGIEADEGVLPTATLRPGSLPRELIDLMENFVMPLITTSADLWLSVARLARWRRRPLAALEANEKAWRAVTSQPGVYEKDEASWEAVVVATEALVKAYEGLAGEERERTGGKVIDGDWRFKARSAVRGVLGKGREIWGDSDGFRRLENIMETFKA